MANPINIAFPLRKGSQGAFATNDTTLQAVADDLRMLILTNHNERVVHSDFGANLRPIIFEMSSNVDQQIADAISSAVEKWMPFVNLIDIAVRDERTDANIRPNEIRVTITFSVNQIQGSLELQVKA